MQKFIEWQPTFNVGNPAIDETRRELFEMVNKIWICRKDDENRKRMVLNQLAADFRRYCEHEERILERNACLNEEHQAEHRLLIKQLMDILEVSYKDPTKGVWPDVMSFLAHNLVLKHMIVTDLKIKKALC